MSGAELLVGRMAKACGLRFSCRQKPGVVVQWDWTERFLEQNVGYSATAALKFAAMKKEE